MAHVGFRGLIFMVVRNVLNLLKITFNTQIGRPCYISNEFK